MGGNLASTNSPGYPDLLRRGELQKRAESLMERMNPCRLCPHQCGVDRQKGETGACRAGSTARVAKALPHRGEEPPVSGTRGAGTIFFAHCNLRCCFCQNYQISQVGLGRDVRIPELADMMLGLQEQGCHNISLVSASHYLPFIAEALVIAADKGLRLPLVYNSNGYDDVETLKLLEGIVDVYLPDAKYAADENAEKYSGAKQYSGVNMAALSEMLRQVGHLEMDGNGIARKGLIVRHLVLPRGLSGTENLLHTLKDTGGRFLALSLMAQYSPCYRAADYPELTVRTSRDEYERAVRLMDELGFENGWTQEWEDMDRTFVPDFEKKDSWN